MLCHCNILVHVFFCVFTFRENSQSISDSQETYSQQLLRGGRMALFNDVVPNSNMGNNSDYWSQSSNSQQVSFWEL